MTDPIDRLIEAIEESNVSKIVAAADEAYPALKQLRDRKTIKISDLIIEFDATPDDGDFEPHHPIFQMAQEIGALRDRVRGLHAGMDGGSKINAKLAAANCALEKRVRELEAESQ